ncbi:MAG: hypothetical protein J6J60_06495 [Clostridia bacterium]|nr:hypothetical protein [Clostridia bacterium]
MKKIRLILIIFNIIVIMAIIIKIANQQINTEYLLEQGVSEENIRYEVKREILYGEKSLYSDFNSEGARVNTSEEMKKEQKMDNGLIVKDYDISYKNNFSQIVATVYNSSDKENGNFPANLVLLNDRNEEIISLKVHINSILPGEETKIVTGITSDIADVYKCEVRLVEE